MCINNDNLPVILVKDFFGNQALKQGETFKNLEEYYKKFMIGEPRFYLLSTGTPDDDDMTAFVTDEDISEVDEDLNFLIEKIQNILYMINYRHDSETADYIDIVKKYLNCTNCQFHPSDNPIDRYIKFDWLGRSWKFFIEDRSDR
jgi:hypothetical protein